MFGDSLDMGTGTPYDGQSPGVGIRGLLFSAFSAGCCFGAQARANVSSPSTVPPLKIDDLTFPPRE